MKPEANPRVKHRLIICGSNKNKIKNPEWLLQADTKGLLMLFQEEWSGDLIHTSPRETLAPQGSLSNLKHNEHVQHEVREHGLYQWKSLYTRSKMTNDSAHHKDAQ